MDYDTTKADEVALALLYMNLMKDKYGYRAWKSISWEIMDRLHEKGYVSNPATKAKSVIVTEAGLKAAEEMFRKHLAVDE
jgi:DNA-binding PadR family transcriptional regulator